MQEHSVELEGTAQEALSAVGEAAELWGAEWERIGSQGRLDLPVTAGLRRGLVQGRLFAQDLRRGSSRLTFHIEQSHYAVHVPALVVLLMGGAGGLATVIVPFVPQFMGILPGATILALVAWFLVVSRLRSRSAQDFLALVAELRSEEENPGSSRGERRSPGIASPRKMF